MAALNEINIIGNVGKDPETKQTPSGAKVSNFSIAVTEKYNDAQGNRQEKTEWISVVAWKRQAEVIEQFVRKGSSLYIKGSLQTRSWDDTASGQKRYKTEVLLRSFQLLGGGQGGQNNSGGSSNQGGYSAPSAPANDGGFGGDFGNMSDPSDDLPF